MTVLRPFPPDLLDSDAGAVQQPIYPGRVQVTGGQAAHGRVSGIARSDDGGLDIALRLPETLGGPGGGSHPGQRLAAAHAACFHGALGLLALRSGFTMPAAGVDVAITVARDAIDGLFVLSAEVRVALPGMGRAAAGELIRNTGRVCPYAKMFRQVIPHTVALLHDSAANDQDTARTGPWR